MRNQNIAIKQMELGINGTQQRVVLSRPKTCAEHTAWWFARMLEAADNAMTWTDKPTPHQQIWFAQ